MAKAVAAILMDRFGCNSKHRFYYVLKLIFWVRPTYNNLILSKPNIQVPQSCSATRNLYWSLLVCLSFEHSRPQPFLLEPWIIYILLYRFVLFFFQQCFRVKKPILAKINYNFYFWRGRKRGETKFMWRVRVPEQLWGTCLFGLESIKLSKVGLTQNISFQYIVEAMFWVAPKSVH